MSAERVEGRRCLGAADLLLVLALVLVGCSGAGGGPAAPGSAPAEPVTAYYTAEQADRGERLYTSACAVCHGPTEFTSPIFRLTWMADPVGSLFGFVSEAMPQDRPGALSQAEYAAIVAYVLRLNGRPPGDGELPTDPALLRAMRW